MTSDDPTPVADGPRCPRDEAAARLHDAVYDLEDLIAEMEGCVASASVISAVLLDQSLHCRGTARALWFVTTRGEDLVERLQTWHAEALPLARAAMAGPRRP